MTPPDRFSTQATSVGFYVWDDVEDRPVGDAFQSEAEADMSAFVLNRDDKTRRGCIELVLAERRKQDAEWGPQDELQSGTWLAVLTKKVGDVSRSLLHNRKPTERELEAELVKVAATAIAWLEVLDRNR